MDRLLIGKRCLKFLAIIFGVIALLCSIVMGFILTPEFITPHVVGVIQQYTKSNVSIKSVDLSLFNRFPNITFKIDSLSIKQTNTDIDDLLFARQCRVAVNPIEILRDKNIAIKHLSLSDAKIYMYVDSLHSPIKTFILPQPRETTQADSLKTIDISDYRLTMKRFIIDSAQIVIDDRSKQFYTRIENFGVDMSMDLSSKISHLDVMTNFSNLIVWRQGDLLVKKTAMELRSMMVVDRDSMQIRFNRANLSVNKINLRTDGLLRRDTISKGIYMNIASSLKTPSISEFLALIPSSVIDKKEKVTTEGEALLNVDIEGVYSDNSFPLIDAVLKIDNAKAKYESRKLELERVDCDAHAFIDLNQPKNSYADINSLYINTSDIIKLQASGKITNLIEDAKVDLRVNSDLDFNRFSEIFPLNDGIICKGTNVSDLKADFKVSNIQNSNYADLYIDGVSTFSNFEMNLDASKFHQDSTSLASLYVQAEKGVVLFGDNVNSKANSRTLRAKINMQDLNYRAKSGEYLAIKDIELIAGANFDRATSKMNGVGFRGIAKNTALSADSLFDANLESADITIIVKPKSPERNAMIDAIIDSRSISIYEPIYDADVNLSAVEMKMTLERDRESNMLKLDGDIHSKELAVTEPTYNTQMNLSRVDMELSITRGEDKQGTIDGLLSFSDFKLLSDIYPLKVAIYETSLSIGDRNIYLNNARLAVGDSELVATGNIHNLLYKMFINPRAALSGQLSIDAPLLDFGAMVEASNHTMLMLEANEEASEAASEAEVEESNAPQQDPEQMQRRMEEAGSSFIVPARMNFIFDFNINKALFYGSVVENFEGRATINKGVLSLEKIELNAIGAKATGSMVYRNISRQESNLLGTVKLERVDINRIGELFPSVHTMMPMLESFEGMVDFDLKANANLDNESQIDISTLCSAMRFKGRNLVLMDGETFAELSKKMMFKNKERNLIDSLEVYALVAESRIDVLPFSISIDRYSAILGGYQIVDPLTYDLDYNYHISVMKSPLPFKAGVDVKGNLEDFDFRVTRAKLKKCDFDEQRQIYDHYCKTMAEIESKRASALAEQRAKMIAARRQQRIIEAQKAKELEQEQEQEQEQEEEQQEQEQESNE